MIELALLALLNRLMTWGLDPLIATRTVAADAPELQRFLSQPANQLRLVGGLARVTGAHVRPSPAGRVTFVELLRGRRTVLGLAWILTSGRGTTEVDLAVQFETRGLATRLALAMGGRRRLARRADAVLGRLAQICARAAEDVVPAPAPAQCAGRLRKTRSRRDVNRAASRPRWRSEVA